MFLGLLSTSEQRVFGQLADAVIRADGEVHDKEIALRSRLGLAGSEAVADGTDTEVVIPEDAFETSPARAALLIELCLLACADGTVSDSERNLLEQTAAALGASAGRVDRLLGYAAELTEVLDRGVELQAEGLQ